MLKKFLSASFLLSFILFFACSTKESVSGNWCDEPFRKGYENYRELVTKHPWFKVYPVGDSVYAIYEPYNWQQVISYLIIGSEKALLFDTGMGLDSIQSVVRELTSLPVTVVNSHTHYDHIGGNSDFNTILGVDTAYTRKNLQGWPHETVKQEVTIASLCPGTLSSVDTANYHIRPYSLTGFIHDGSVIDLGGRQLEVMIIPGHTPDCVALLDRAAGLLWTGDTYYEGPLWLFFPGTDLEAYEKTITRLASLFPDLKHLHPAHNLPVITPQRLVEVRDGLALVRSGQKKGEALDKVGNPLATDVMEFKFDGFSFLIRRDLLK
jgi:glyoxylase-like metal-dependent hydrolase (beta-lactamase superfamily II)